MTNKKPNNRPVISHGTNNHYIHNRSVAQPLPESKVDEVKEKVNASEEEKLKALERNSVKGKTYNKKEDDK